jgi:SAM-dependent methyltransferase
MLIQLGEKVRKQGALWGIEARDWLEIQERKSPALWRPVLDLARVGAGTRMLDAGCGAGGASVMARERGAIVSGCDISEPMLAIARERLPGADLRLAELENLPFEDGLFDAAVAVNSLQFAPDPARAAGELLRVTAPGGRVAVVVWSIDHCEQKRIFDAMLSLFETPPKGRGVFALSSPGEVEALFEGSAVETPEIDCAFEYTDLETALRGQMAAGPSQRVVEIFGREKVEAVVRTALGPFVTGTGEVRMLNRFRCAVVGQPVLPAV